MPILPPDESENRFKVHGRWYIAKEQQYMRCDKCAFLDDGEGCFKAPNCIASKRRDNRIVYFVREIK